MLQQQSSRRSPAALRGVLMVAALVGLVLAGPPAARAGTLDCPVKVTDLWIYAKTGYLFATARWQVGTQTHVKTWAMCNLKVAVNGIEPAVCSEIYAQLLVARTTDKTVVISFNDTVPAQGGGGGGNACDLIWNFSSTVADHLWYIRLREN